MKFLIILALIGLSYSQLPPPVDPSVDPTAGLPNLNTFYSLRATAVLRGETIHPHTFVTYKILGTVTFEQTELFGNVTITVDINGLPPHFDDSGVLRGLHIHEYGILVASDDVKTTCASTGSHYNPTNETHGLIDSPVRHVGDLGNVVTFKNGTIRAVLVSDRLELYGPYSIIGRSVVLHQYKDDGGVEDTELSRTVGTSGPRIACGVISLDIPRPIEGDFGYVPYYGFTLELNETIPDPMAFIDKFFSFEDNYTQPILNGTVTGIFDDFEDVHDNDMMDNTLMAGTDRPLFRLFSNFLTKFVDRTNAFDNSMNNNSSGVNQTDRFAFLRGRVFNFL